MHVNLVDLSSNIHRTYNGCCAHQTIDKNDAKQFYRGVPIYCVKSTIQQVLKERRKVASGRGRITHDLMVCDHSGQNFRHELYPEYKADRKEHDDDLKVQEVLIIECLKALGFATICKEGVEADDVIGTVARKCSNNKIKTTITARDKDLFVLVDDNVQVFSGSHNIFFDYQGVIDKSGVIPSKVSDFLILDGDTVDNIPGVKGFGPKSISTVFQDHTLDELLDNPDLILDMKVRGAKGLAERLRSSIAEVNKMKPIAYLKYDVQLGQNLNQWQSPKLSYVPDNMDEIIKSVVDNYLTTNH